LAGVTAVITAHNEEGLIREAIASALAQTHAECEVLVVDDGSTDRTAEVAEGVGDSRIRVFREAHAGRSAALNKGIAMATHEFIAILDADDLWLPDRCGRQVAFLDAHPEVAVVGSSAYLRDRQGRERLLRVPTSDRAIRRAMAWGNPFVHSSAMMRRSALQACGGYADTRFEDYHLMVRIAAAHPVANLAEPLVVRRLGPGSHGRSGPRSHRLRTKLEFQRLAVQWLDLPATARLGLVPTLLGVAAFGALEWFTAS